MVYVTKFKSAGDQLGLKPISERTMNHLASSRTVYNLLWVCATLLFLVAEVTAFLLFKRVDLLHLAFSVSERWLSVLVLALPFVSGLNGLKSLKRRAAGSGELNEIALAIQFLLTVCLSYVAFIVCLSPILKFLLEHTM